jgi:hypothetical protein
MDNLIGLILSALLLGYLLVALLVQSVSNMSDTAAGLPQVGALIAALALCYRPQPRSSTARTPATSPPTPSSPAVPGSIRPSAPSTPRSRSTESPASAASNPAPCAASSTSAPPAARSASWASRE